MHLGDELVSVLLTMTPQPPPLHLPIPIYAWVLLPIYISTILLGLIRRNLSSLFNRPPLVTLPKLASANHLSRSKHLRRNSSCISAAQFYARRNYFTAADGPLDVPPRQNTSMAALMNPESLANQVMSLVLALIPNVLLGTWARYMFAGMVVCQLPITLPPKFRTMLQAGIDLGARGLDVSYVSAFSWYILNMFGNAGLITLVSKTKGDDHIFVPSVASQVAANVAPERAFQQERTALKKMAHRSKLHEAEDKFLHMDPSQFSSF